MPIEIKELQIKVTVQENDSSQSNNQALDNQQIQILKKEITQACLQLVLEKLKEKSER